MLAGTATVLLAVVFSAAAISKLRARVAFRGVLREVFSGPSTVLVSYLIPVVELVLAGALLTGLVPRAVGAASVALLVVFTLVLTRMWSEDSAQDCGCFGESPRASTPASGVLRNVLLITGAFAIIVDPAGSAAWNDDAERAVSYVVIAAGAVCAWLLVQAAVNGREILRAGGVVP